MQNDPDFHERYNRQLILPGFGEDAQRKLASASVLVIGAGGLGCPALTYLAGAGVGKIGIVDDDVVSLSNLHRQVLYTADDIGQPKVRIAAARLTRQNPGIGIFPFQVRLDNNNALPIMRQFDYIIDGSDNFETRYLVNDACVLLGKPLIFGAVSQFEGQVAVFNVAGGPNYRDLFPVAPDDGEVLNCAEAGVLGVLPGIIGMMQAIECIKLMTGIGSTLAGRLLTYNLLQGSSYEIAITPNKNSYKLPADEESFKTTEYGFHCSTPVIGMFAPINEVNADEFRTLLDDREVTSIDVREFGERPLFKGAVHQQIPLSILEQVAPDMHGKRFLLFCQSGVRSLKAARILQKALGKGIEVYSLKGGLGQFNEPVMINFMT